MISVTKDTSMPNKLVNYIISIDTSIGPEILADGITSKVEEQKTTRG